MIDKYKLDPILEKEITYHLERIKALVAIHYFEHDKAVHLESRGMIPTNEGLIQIQLLIKPTNTRTPFDVDWNEIHDKFRIRTI